MPECRCPKCSTLTAIHENLIGQTILCPKCRTKYTGTREITLFDIEEATQSVTTLSSVTTTPEPPWRSVIRTEIVGTLDDVLKRFVLVIALVVLVVFGCCCGMPLVLTGLAPKHPAIQR